MGTRPLRESARRLANRQTLWSITGGRDSQLKRENLRRPSRREAFLARRVRQGYRCEVKLEGIIRSDPEILGGTPVFVGTRVPVRSLFDHLEAGESIDDFLEGFPSVQRQQVLAVLEASRKEILQPA